MSFSEGISFEDETAMYQAGIDIDDDTHGVPEEEMDDETTPLPEAGESMSVVVNEGRR